MRTSAPPLLPIFRSARQADLLATLFLHPEKDYTLAELARELRVSPSTLHRDVHQLIQADLITTRPVGRAQLLRANLTNRISEPLTRLLLMTVGPHLIVAEEFATVGGVQAACIYGSWAARYHGEPGPPPNDVDILVIGTPARSDVYDAADRVEQRIGFSVNPVIRSPERWLDPSDPLIREVKAAPIVVAFGDLPIEHSEDQ